MKWTFKISADGKRIVANSQSATGPDRYSIDVWDATSGQSIFDFRYPQDKQWRCETSNSITPDGTKVASLVRKSDLFTGHIQMEFFAIDLRTKTKIGQSTVANPVWHGNLVVIAATDNRSALVCNGHESLTVWDIPTAKYVRTLLDVSDASTPPCFSPNGRLLAIAGSIDDDDKSPSLYYVRIIEWASGQVRREIPLESQGQSLCFHPDGTQLAIGTSDSTVLIFDVGKSLPLIEKLHTPDELTDAICGNSAKRAWDAIRELSTRPEVAIPLLSAKIQPIPKLAKPTPEQIAAWLVQLDAPAFAVRESASQFLKAKGIGFVAELQAATQTTPSLEVKSRLETIVEHLLKPPLPNVMEARAIELLERIGSADAQTLLAKIAAGEPTHVFTQDAIASLKRLQLRK